MLSLVLDDPDSVDVDAPSSAEAIAGLLAIAAPIPNATASPPTLPMNRPYEYGAVATGRVLPPKHLPTANALRVL